MTVRELIEALKEMPPELPVTCWQELEVNWVEIQHVKLYDSWGDSDRRHVVID